MKIDNVKNIEGNYFLYRDDENNLSKDIYFCIEQSPKAYKKSKLSSDKKTEDLYSKFRKVKSAITIKSYMSKTKEGNYRIKYLYIRDTLENLKDGTRDIELLSEEAVKATLKTLQEQEKKDRKSTRLNSSHVSISYAVFCLKKKKK